MHHFVDAFHAQGHQAHCEIDSAEVYLFVKDDLK